MKITMNNEVKKFLSKIGKKGGRSTVDRHGKLKMSEWGKLGGWPKGRKRKPVKIPLKTLDITSR
jgi:general stress protein YciG